MKGRSGGKKAEHTNIQDTNNPPPTFPPPYHAPTTRYILLPFASQKVLSRSVGKSFTDKLQGVRQLFKSKNESQLSALKPPATQYPTNENTDDNAEAPYNRIIRSKHLGSPTCPRVSFEDTLRRSGKARAEAQNEAPRRVERGDGINSIHTIFIGVGGVKGKEVKRGGALSGQKGEIGKRPQKVTIFSGAAINDSILPGADRRKTEKDESAPPSILLAESKQARGDLTKPLVYGCLKRPTKGIANCSRQLLRKVPTGKLLSPNFNYRFATAKSAHSLHSLHAAPSVCDSASDRKVSLLTSGVGGTWVGGRAGCHLDTDQQKAATSNLQVSNGRRRQERGVSGWRQLKLGADAIKNNPLFPGKVDSMPRARPKKHSPPSAAKRGNADLANLPLEYPSKPEPGPATAGCHQDDARGFALPLMNREMIGKY
ncbi:hypothetical protein C0Q70_16901 [Pomacea canaliculata]|uniref:Uncharacterized protein n=1 Tax=Pomacea canaliculata TaxID=400727 RepID=A0A2T7NR44_POMCA|nr:hypothetical protein C0Q70_16901 [Pomacea canaliculata]